MHRLILLFTIVAVPFCGAYSASPNIILMMADDMGMGDTSAFQDFTGNTDDVQVHTPQMERLARMGIRFTDAHTPSSRCSPTRYGLLTGRYPWRNRLKHWVLFGSQGDPMIEADRPTLASLLGTRGYATGMFGKWHVGLRYRQTDGRPAAGWNDADLQQPLFDTPIDHGFDQARFTSRSHGTSGPDPTQRKKGKSTNTPKQNIGPGHLHGRIAIGATKNGKQLVARGPKAYVLKQLGGRHSRHAIDFMESHVSGEDSGQRPFFVYYPSNSNHGPYTPDSDIDGKAVEGAARTVAGEAMDKRHDYIYENDVALGRMIDWLSQTDDPRSDGKKLIENTLVIFTSDNGAEKNSDVATGPFRSNKGSTYEGGHRVPFVAAWPAGGVGDGDDATPGQTNASPIGLVDLYATFAEIVGAELPRLERGEKGGEDSFSVLAALRGEVLAARPPMFFHDHKEAKDDPAVSAIRVDSPRIGDKIFEGQWKLFFDAGLLRRGTAKPIELYNLQFDRYEQKNLIGEATLAPLVDHLVGVATLHRNAGGHRTAAIASSQQTTLDFLSETRATINQGDGKTLSYLARAGDAPIKVTVTAEGGSLVHDDLGLGVSGGKSKSVESGEALAIRLDRDAIIESVSLVAGNAGTCGGFYTVGGAAPLAIYCVDGDIDAKDQSGVLSDLGVLRAGEWLRLDSSRHYGVEDAGNWRVTALSVRLLKAAE